MDVYLLPSKRVFQEKQECAPTPHALWTVPDRIPVHSITNGCQVSAGQPGGLAIRIKVLISLEEHISPQPEHSKFEIIAVISAVSFSFASRLESIFILVLQFYYNHFPFGYPELRSS
jgi:hypothetical protein